MIKLVTMTDLKTMPKAELHRHLELCVRASTIRELAPSAGIAPVNTINPASPTHAAASLVHFADVMLGS